MFIMGITVFMREQMPATLLPTKTGFILSNSISQLVKPGPFHSLEVKLQSVPNKSIMRMNPELTRVEL